MWLDVTRARRIGAPGGGIAARELAGIRKKLPYRPRRHASETAVAVKAGAKAQVARTGDEVAVAAMPTAHTVTAGAPIVTLRLLG